MPFAVAWTDDLQHDRFVSFHREAWAGWTPAKWSCNLITFLDGEPIGTQGIDAENFAEQREVMTGSWLGAPFQGQGYGTEQRAACSSSPSAAWARRPRSAARCEHNIASQRVSAKLGYRQTGTSEIAPRGEPVPHYDYRLEAADWRSPVPVELVGLASCLPLFGAFPRSG